MGNGIYYPPQAAITLAKSILESQNVKSTTLPADFHYDPNAILQLYLKPAFKVRVFSRSLFAMIPCTKPLSTKCLKCFGMLLRAGEEPPCLSLN